MSQRTFNIDTHEVAIHVNRLERMNKRAFPNAVRGTLNSMAFKTKKVEMPKEAEKFTNRQRNFFRYFSRVEMARGNDIRMMRSTVGFVGGDKNQAVADLEQQEHGGVIKGRSFIPVDKARVSNSPQRNVRKKNRISGIGNVVVVKDAKHATAKGKFVKSAIHAGVGGILLTSNALVRVKKLKRESRNRWKIQTEMLYSFKKGRTVKVRATHFMKKASDRVQENGNKIFIKEAEFQLNKMK